MECGTVDHMTIGTFSIGSFFIMQRLDELTNKIAQLYAHPAIQPLYLEHYDQPIPLNPPTDVVKASLYCY